MTPTPIPVPSDFKWQRGTTANLAARNPVLRNGEPCLDTDTGMFKIGDGIRPWLSLGPGRSYLNALQVLQAIQEVIGEGGGSGSDSRIGDMGDLTTEDDSSIVAAINEVNCDGISYNLLYENAKAG